ncbi:leucine-rich repeat domain-containing protein [Dyella subtropica]|uniref:leucine-rich repeat domain-containing protein n=1 Tax=Dyella subtropica TaxID=2992127 RepID=UPI0022541D6E|nr:leucine-rich repeat domain-containing protein [Dyella subtropica]
MQSETPYAMTLSPFHTSRWPRSIVNVADYDGGERLTLSWDLGRVSETEKKQAIRQWCLKLPELQHVRWLSLWTHVTQPLFDAACQIHDLECFNTKGSNVKSLRAIEHLRKLRYLSIGKSTKVESVEPLAALSDLKQLHIENFKSITDFSPLLALTGLESLSVTGSMWTRQKVASLEPFAHMTWLQTLTVDTSSVHSLRPLANLKNLKELGVGGRLPMQEYAWLAAKLPNTECRWFSAYFELASSGIGRCKKCNQNSEVMLTGKGAGCACKHCDKEKVQRHEAAFHEAMERAKAE